MRLFLRILQRGSIRTRLAFVITMLIGLISLFIFFYFPSKLERQQLETIAAKAKSISDMTAFSISSALLSQDTKSIKEALDASKQNRSLVYIAVTNDSNRVIESFKDYSAFDGDIAGTAGNWQTHIGSQIGDIYRVTTTIKSDSKEIGRLFLGFSLKELRREIKRSQTTIALVSLVLFLIGMIFVFGISTAITNPLRNIVKTVERIAQGDLAQRAQISSNDEVGHLAKSLNLMAENLQSAYQELEEMNRTLERRVNERTKELQQEINERRQTEVALRESEEKYRTIFEGSRDSIYITTRDGKIVSVNEALLTMFGFAREEVDQLNSQEFYANPEDRIRFQEAVEEKGYVKNFEVKLLKKDGTPMDCLITATAWRDKGGTLLGYHGIMIDITERKRQEEELRLLKKQMEFILGVTKTGLNIIDSEFNVRYVDPEWAKIYGDYKGRKCYEYFVGKNEVCMNCVIAQALKTKMMVVKEGILPKENNRPIQIVTVPFQDEKGDWLFAEVNVDLTERKRAEKALKESERRYRQLVELAQEGIWLIDANAITTFVNPRMAEMLGYTVKEMIGRHLFSFMDEQGIEICKSNIERRKKGIREQHDFEFIRKDGSRIYTSLETNPVTDNDGKYLGALAVVADITERKCAEDALRKANRSLKVLISCNEVLVRATEETDLLNEICRLIVEIGGYRLAWVGFAEQDDGKTVKLVAMAGREADYFKNLKITWADTEHGQGPSGTAIRTGKLCVIKNIETFPNYVPWRAHANKLGFISAIAIPLINQNKPFGVLNIYSSEPDAFNAEEVKLLSELTDDLAYGIVSLRTRAEQKRAEAEIIKLNEELEQRVKERTAELEQAYEQLRLTREQFYQAQKMESIGILAGGIAHDFNNLLATIMGNISLAKMMTKPEEKIFQILTRAENVSLRAKDLTQQLLTFSKGGAPMKNVTLVSKILKEAANIALRGSKVSCEFSVTDEIWPVEVDEGQLIQGINNMIINADQAMPKGGKIKVWAENIKINEKSSLPLEAGNYVKIAIQDRGVGIPEENLSKIFDPFYSTKPRGTGLGLTTVYSIIKKHNGHIAVESEIGVGSTFYIYLPAANTGISVKRDVSQKSEAQLIVKSKGKILIMDDEKSVLETVAAILTHFGFATECAKDGLETISLYQKAKESGQPFDVVIMDLTIKGGMGGKEAIKELLKIDPRVKAIVSSGYFNDPIMADFRKYGFSGVVAKPYKAEDIIKTLNQVLSAINKKSEPLTISKN
ncbi:MAG: PAS domain S-box protein [candidate division WOR-3 bacterium]|nr:PAS domain S-box protein [candidate division WOR-3 bacterium]MDH5682974.1 PAS domain S-box protein [candidate division WOR-3 bacterium]